MTSKQDELLKFLWAAQLAGGAMPSVDEMAGALSLKSKSGVCRLLDALVEQGRISRPASRARAIEVIRPPISDGLTTEEWRWCTANPALVRAAMAGAA